MPKPLTPDNLEQNGYVLHVHLAHLDLVAFIKQYFFMKNPVTIFYWLFNLLLVSGGVCFLFLADSAGDSLLKLFLGFFVFFLIVPVHELIHGIGYKLAGAEKVTFKAVWKQMVFYAMADRFVANKKQFVLLAIAPFLLINTLFISLFFYLPEPFSWVSYGALLMHTAGCSGDFALMSYFYNYWEKNPVTYDDVAGQMSYFYLKKD